MVTIGVAADGRTKSARVLETGDIVNEGFWTLVLRFLKNRGLDGVPLVISDAHAGVERAIAPVLQGATWQRCRVHFMRGLLFVVPKRQQEMAADLDESPCRRDTTRKKQAAPVS